MLRVLRLLLAFAVDEGEIERNPAEKMRLKVSAPRDQVWTPEQIEAFVTAANANGRASIGLAVLLGAGLGQREGDVLRLGWTQYDGASVRLRQRKTGKLIAVPAIADLRQALDAAPRRRHRRGERDHRQALHRRQLHAPVPRDRRRGGAAGDLQFRDLRRTAVVFLAEAGCSVPERAFEPPTY